MPGNGVRDQMCYFLLCSNSTSGSIPQRIESQVLRHLYTCVNNSIVQSSQTVEATQVSMDKRVDKQNAVHMHNGILFSLKPKDHKQKRIFFKKICLFLATNVQTLPYATHVISRNIERMPNIYVKKKVQVFLFASSHTQHNKISVHGVLWTVSF